MRGPEEQQGPCPTYPGTAGPSMPPPMKMESATGGLVCLPHLGQCCFRQLRPSQWPKASWGPGAKDGWSYCHWQVAQVCSRHWAHWSLKDLCWENKTTLWEPWLWYLLFSVTCVPVFVTRSRNKTPQGWWRMQLPGRRRRGQVFQLCH